MDSDQGRFDWGFGGTNAPQQPAEPQLPPQSPRQLPPREDPFAAIQRPVKEEVPSWDADLSFDPSDLGFVPIEIPRKSLGRRLVGPIIFLIVIAGLAVFGTIAADSFARDAVSGVIAGTIGDAFEGKEADVTVDLGEGLFLGQAITGTIDDVFVGIPAATLGTLTGAVTLTAEGVPTSPRQPADSLAITLAMPEESALAFAATLAGEGTTASLGEGVISVAAKKMGKTISVAFVPTAADGALVLTPQTITVGKTVMTPEEFADSKYASAGKSLVATRTLCVADKLPSALTFDSIDITATSIRIAASGTKVPLIGGGITTPGVCEAE